VPHRPLSRVVSRTRFWIVLAAGLFYAVPADARPVARGVIDFTCMVPMRDGTHLATDVYVPRFPRGAYPIILVRTTDGKDQVTKLMARYVCRRGCGLVVQDVRGRHDSGGRNVVVFFDDGWGRNRDGHDTLRWIARQPWCNGRIATWGVSAMGVMENMLAPDAPTNLKAQHVMFAFSDMYSQAAYQGGVLRQSLVDGWLKGKGFAPINVERLLANPTYGPRWEGLNCETQAARVNTPAVFWGGWYDIFLQGTINSFVTIHNQGGPGARGRCRLILGPWNHHDAERLADPRNAGCFPAAGDAFRFFEYYLRGEANGAGCDRPVHYYVMGACEPRAPGNHWRTADNWPPQAEETNFYFHADGSLNRETPQEADGRRTYEYNPKEPVPTVGGLNMFGSYGPLDQRKVESRPDVLLFTTAPLERPLEATGRIRAELFVSSDCPDTDFTVKLTDVYPDGRSILLCDGILRARFHKSFEEENFLEPGKVYRLVVDLWSTSYAFPKGHRIRVAVSSSNAPRFQPNRNTGESPRAGGKPRIATNTLHLSPEHPSHIILPVYRAGK
jgi:predicted acyl esterase